MPLITAAFRLHAKGKGERKSGNQVEKEGGQGQALQLPYLIILELTSHAG